MEPDAQYAAWKEKRSRITHSPQFEETVMQKIEAELAPKRKPRWNFKAGWQRVLGNPLAQAGMIGIGALGGLIRIALVLRVLLGCASLKGFF